jgi:hypothetical protein
LNTYKHTEEEVSQAIKIMDEVFEDSDQYKNLSDSAKDLLANAFITAVDLTRK